MTIEEFLRLLLRNALLLIILTVVGAAAGYGFSYTKAPVYQATALGYVATTVRTDENGNVLPASVGAPSGGEDSKYGTAQTFLPLFGTRSVGQSIKDELGLDQGPDAIASGLVATIDPNAPIITVNARSSDPVAAMEIANASIGAVNAEGAFLQTGDRENQNAPMKLIPYQSAEGQGVPVAPDRLKYAGIGAGAGLLVALALSWLRNRNDSRVRTVDDIKAKTTVSALGVLPESKDLARGKDGKLPEPKDFHSKEALRKLRTNLRFANVDNPPRSIVVSSSAPGEGKSTVSANLARVIAKSGQPVVLIDADLRRPVVAKEFGIDGSVGLSQLIAGAVEIDDVLHQTQHSNLSILPAGQIPPNPSELLGSQRMRDLVQKLAEKYFVVIDAPPILAVTDAVLLSRHADGAILVAVPGRTRVEGLSRAIDSITGVQGHVLGVVMNRASTSRINRLAYGDAEYGYSSYGYQSYHYQYHAENERKRNRKNAVAAPAGSEAPEGQYEDVTPAAPGAPAPTAESAQAQPKKTFPRASGETQAAQPRAAQSTATAASAASATSASTAPLGGRARARRAAKAAASQQSVSRFPTRSE